MKTPRLRKRLPKKHTLTKLLVVAVLLWLIVAYPQHSADMLRDALGSLQVFVTSLNIGGGSR